jgi:ribosomal protein S27AE
MGVSVPIAIEPTTRKPVACPRCGEIVTLADHGKPGLLHSWRDGLWLFYMSISGVAAWVSIWLLVGAGWRLADYCLTQVTS